MTPQPVQPNELRALRGLASSGARLLPWGQGRRYGLFQGEDRRRRPLASLSEAAVKRLVERGLLLREGEAYRLGPHALDCMGAPAASALAVRSESPAWLAPEERAALDRLAREVEACAAGGLRGVDWSRPREEARGRRGDPLAQGAEARGRVRAAWAALAPPLAQALQGFALEGLGLAELERRHGWPPRSARLAVRFAAAQLAHHYRFAAPPSAAEAS